MATALEFLAVTLTLSKALSRRWGCRNSRRLAYGMLSTMARTSDVFETVELLEDSAPVACASPWTSSSLA